MRMPRLPGSTDITAQTGVGGTMDHEECLDLLNQAASPSTVITVENLVSRARHFVPIETYHMAGQMQHGRGGVVPSTGFAIHTNA